MSLSEVQTFGYGRSVRELYVTNREVLEAGGVDVDHALEEIDEAQEDAEKGNAVQEERKRLLKEATDAFLPKKLRLFHVTSNALDKAIAAAGKETPAGRNFRRIRSDMTREVRPEDLLETPGGQPNDAPA